MKDACGEYHSAENGCDLGITSCCNCLEQGYTNKLQERVYTSSAAPQEFSTGNLRQFFSSVLPQIFGRLYDRLDGLTSRVFQLISPLLLPVFLYLPIYYSSQASEILACFDECRNEYVQWIDASNSFLSTEAPSAVDGNANDINHHASRTSDQCSVRIVPDGDDFAGLFPHDVAVLPLTERVAPPSSVIRLQHLWFNYLNLRIIEWKTLLTSACVFVAASPTIFQIPEASDDPITRSVAFFALCRAFSGIVFGPIFLLYFRRSQPRSVHFAFLWCQKVGGSQTTGTRRSLWMMLSLPAVATCWAAIFYLVAIFSFIWRSGSIADPSPDSEDHTAYHPLAIPLAIMIRTIITIVTVADFGCMVWVWKTLKSDLSLCKESSILERHQGSSC